MKKTLVHLIIIFAISVFLMSQTFFQVANGHDFLFYYGNTFVLQSVWQGGDWSLTSTEIMPLIMANLGYGIRIFYPPLPHAIPAFFSLFTTTFNLGGVRTGMMIFEFLIVFLSGVSMYGAIWGINKLGIGKKNSNFALNPLLGASLYLSFPYFLSEFYIRSALGEAMTFVVLPMILIGVVAFYKKRYIITEWTFLLGFAYLFYSHLITTLYTAIIVFLLLLAGIWRWIKEWPAWKALLMAVAGAILLTLPYSVSLIEQATSGTEYVIFDGEGSRSREDVAESAISLHYIFRFLDNRPSDIVYTISPVIILLLIIGLYGFKKGNKEQNIIYITLGAIGAICILLACLPDFWLYMPELINFIQFPWRLLVFTTLTWSLAACFGLAYFSGKLQTVLITAAIVASVGIAYISIDEQKLEPTAGFDQNSGSIERARGAHEEHMSKNAKDNLDDLLKRENGVIIENIEATASTQVQVMVDAPPRLEFYLNVDSSTVAAHLELPRLYYLGYTVELENSAGEIKHLDYQENERGLIEIVASESGKITLEYTGTIAYRIAVVISGLTGAAMIAYGVWSLSKRYKKKRVIAKKTR